MRICLDNVVDDGYWPCWVCYACYKTVESSRSTSFGEP